MRSGLIVFAAVLAAGTLSVHALPGRMGIITSPTTMFSWNGTSYSLGKRCRETSVLREKLIEWGVDPSRLPREFVEPDDRIVDALREVPPSRRSRSISFPLSFPTNHGMQLDTGDALVEIADGVIPGEGRSARERLEAAGWKTVNAGNAGTGICMAFRTEGKETSIGILEEKEGRGLFIRRSEK